MPKGIDWTTFIDEMQRRGSETFMIGEDIKRLKEAQKQKQKEYELTEANILSQIKQRAVQDAIDTYRAELAGRPKEAETPKHTIVEYRGLPGKGGAAETSKLSLNDIEKIYRKDFFSPEVQEWAVNVSQAARANDWAKFMQLGQRIPELETTISQGIAGTSEAIKPQMISAQAFWGAIYDNLYPQNLVTQPTPTAPTFRYTGEPSGVGAGLPPEVKNEVNNILRMYLAGNTDEANAAYLKLIERVDKATVDELIKTLGR